MTDNYAQYFSATAENTDGSLFTTFDSTGFNVGATNNATAVVYHYVAFKNVTDKIKAGTYTTADATDNKSITDPGFQPDFVFVKGTAAVGAVYTIDEHYGDMSGYFTDTARAVNMIQKLEPTGFQVGTTSVVNGTGLTFWYLAFAGKPAPNASGTFKMTSGTYTGNGGTDHINISDLAFAPDLVIIKGDTAQHGVFRTDLIEGNATAYFGNGVANYTNGIIALNNDGFTIGTSAVTNTNGATYY